MRVLHIYLSLMILAVVLLPVSALAADPRGDVAAVAEGSHKELAMFSNTMPDLPLMPGLREMEDQAVVFDKAEGRIVEVAASLEQGSAQDVLQYYAHSLPQFGWEQITADQYRRDGESLTISFEKLAGATYVKFSLSP